MCWGGRTGEEVLSMVLGRRSCQGYWGGGNGKAQGGGQMDGLG